MSIWQDLWASFKAVFGPVATMAALALAVWGGLYPPAATVQVSVIWIVVAVIVFATTLLSSWNMVTVARRQARAELPRTLGAFPVVGGNATLLLDRSELFGFNVLVAIYYTETVGGRAGTLERLIGVGRVSNVQQNGLIQVTVLREFEGHEERWRTILARDATPLEHIVVKPSVPYDWAEEGRIDE